MLSKDFFPGTMIEIRTELKGHSSRWDKHTLRRVIRRVQMCYDIILWSGPQMIHRPLHFTLFNGKDLHIFGNCRIDMPDFSLQLSRGIFKHRSFFGSADFQAHSKTIRSFSQNNLYLTSF